MNRGMILGLVMYVGFWHSAEGAQRAVTESARKIPVAYNVDVVVVGGSTGGVAAAVAAAESGAKVFLAAPRPYLGEDMTATLRLWLEPGEEPKSDLGRKIFSEGSPARPLHVKQTLDQALLDAGVEFLYSSYATDVLRDAGGNSCGIVMANRAGRQAVTAKVIIDATDRAWVARMAGAKFTDFPGGAQTLKRVVIGGEVHEGEGMKARKIEPGFTYKNKTYDVIEYTLELPVKNDSFGSWAAAEQLARDKTYHPDQQFASDVLFQVPPEHVEGAKTVTDEDDRLSPPDLAAFRPKGIAHLMVVSGVGDIPRDMAATILRPLALIDMGTLIGRDAAGEAKRLPPPEGVHLPAAQGKAASSRRTPKPSAITQCEVRETLGGIRPFEEYATIPQEARTLPVLGEYDVVVIGGGTSGAPTGIGAGRQKTKTLVVEYLHGLGGVGTMGAISKYYHGYRGGFTKEVAGGGSWQIEQKMEWWRTTLRDAGADVWFGVLGCGAVVHEGKVIGAVVATPQGRGVVLADVVVDSTGNADIAAAAGAPCMYTDASDIAMQGTGLPPRELGASYRNTDFTMTDETDMIDITSLFVYAKSKYPKDAFDAGQLIDTRERRTIVGDYTLTILDQLNNRTFSDTIGQSKTNFDTHGYTVDPLFTLRHPDQSVEVQCYTPYRCLLPRGLDGILVTGLGVSAHRDAIPLIRMQPDLQNQGYAAGVAAAMAAKDDLPTRSIDIRKLQKHLVEIGNVPESVLTDEDAFPIPAEKLAEAVESVQNDYRDVSVLLAQPAQSLPLLRQAYAGAQTDEDKLTYVHVLGMMGDATGIETLIAAAEAAAEWDKGWNFRGMGQFGANLSPLDSLILALGTTRDRRATPVILKKVERLDADKDFSHHRTVALALERLRDPAAAAALADLLAKPGMGGHAMTTIENARARHVKAKEGLNALQPRRESLRELMLARALFRCGDKDGIGRRILETYRQDVRGHFARHADAVLKETTK